MPGAAIGTGKAVVFETLAGCNFAALLVATADLAVWLVWAFAVKALVECGARCHAAPAKRRQEIPVKIRTDEERK